MVNHCLALVVVEQGEGRVGVVLSEPRDPLKTPQPVARRLIAARRNIVPADVLDVCIQGFVKGARDNLPREFAVRWQGTLLP